MLLPFCPLAAGYTASFDDGVSRIALAGGQGRYRVEMAGNSTSVNATWALRAENYSLFMGFYRDWSRTAAMFEVDLKLDSHQIKRYTASFIPGSVQLVSKNAKIYRVSAQLEVLPLPEFSDADLDYWWSVLQLFIIYGSYETVLQVLNLLAKLVNEDLPHA